MRNKLLRLARLLAERLLLGRRPTVTVITTSHSVRWNDDEFQWLPRRQGGNTTPRQSQNEPARVRPELVCKPLTGDSEE
ncbi:MAG TPA: hypothetical protein VNJ11_01060 [Bryobacteraceae bacterium]|nr:hypothetical protein [Bryobacteraceae bacterium]